MMIGNSLGSDVVPALSAGAWGVHVPSPYNWVLDRHDGPLDSPRFRQLADVGAVVPLVAEIEKCVSVCDASVRTIQYFVFKLD